MIENNFVALDFSLEPPPLLHYFKAHPPANFAVCDMDGVCAFKTCFKLLTTLDVELLKKLKKLPFFQIVQRLLSAQTLFIGSTVTEYMVLPKNGGDDDVWVKKLATQLDVSFVIAKDLPAHSPLLSAEENKRAAAMAKSLENAGFVQLQGQALAYVTINFSTVDEYLARLSYGRRKNIKRKLKSRAALTITIKKSGDCYFQNDAICAQFYQLYLNVFAQSELQFDLLAPEYFRAIFQNTASAAIIFIYSYQDEIIGYNICFEYENKLIDKYIGFQYEKSREFNLYFVSWIFNIEYALSQGFTHYVAGWSDPEIKSYLGSSFTLTAHWVRPKHFIVRVLLRKLSKYFESDSQWLEKNSQQNKAGTIETIVGLKDGS